MTKMNNELEIDIKYIRCLSDINRENIENEIFTKEIEDINNRIKEEALKGNYFYVRYLPDKVNNSIRKRIIKYYEDRGFSVKFTKLELDYNLIPKITIITIIW